MQTHPAWQGRKVPFLKPHLLEDWDEDGDNQLWPVAPAQDGEPGVLDGAGHVDSINNVLQLNSHICKVTHRQAQGAGNVSGPECEQVGHTPTDW